MELRHPRFQDANTLFEKGKDYAFREKYQSFRP